VIWTFAPKNTFHNTDSKLPVPTDQSSVPENGSDAQPATSAAHDTDGIIGPNIASYAVPPKHELPPLDSPLRDTFAELDRRAKSGDSAASCRLSADVFRCERLPLERQYNIDAMSTAANKPPGTAEEERAIKLIAARRESLAKDERLCEGFEKIKSRSAWDYLKLAAADGNTHAMVQLAADPPLDSRNFLRDVDQWAEYRRIAGPYLKQAAYAGEPYALFYLWWMSAGYPSAGGEAVIPPDPYMTRVLGNAIFQIGDDRTIEIIQKYFTRTPGLLTIAQEAQAKLEGLELARKTFSRVSKVRLNNFPRREKHCTGDGVPQS